MEEHNRLKRVLLTDADLQGSGIADSSTRVLRVRALAGK